jgi:hypothetical protein
MLLVWDPQEMWMVLLLGLPLAVRSEMRTGWWWGLLWETEWATSVMLLGSM